jgi:hypothetical protein
MSVERGKWLFSAFSADAQHSSASLSSTSPLMLSSSISSSSRHPLVIISVDYRLSSAPQHAQCINVIGGRNSLIFQLGCNQAQHWAGSVLLLFFFCILFVFLLICALLCLL